MVQFKRIKADDEKEIEALSAIAKEIVKEHYDPIIGAEQNDYMINMFQSVEAIKRQLAQNHLFYMVKDGDKNIGYFAFYEKEGQLYLDKYYIHKNARGNGYGSAAMQIIKGLGREAGYTHIFLNVNKHNTDSINMYKHMGFKLKREEKNPIGNGYFMDDYVLECEIGDTPCSGE